MADTKISALASAAALVGGEKIPAVQGGANVAVTPSQIAVFVGGNRSWYAANAGSDTNSGLSPATPFQTLAKVLSVMATGDTVLLRCSDTFRESFDVSGFGRVTIGNYGGGFRPVIDGADIITQSWTLVSGNVYRVSITIPEQGFATRVYPGIFENGLLLVEKDIVLDGLSSSAAQIAAVQATPGSFLLESPVAYRDGYAAGATFSYIVQATGGGSPASNGNLYEVRKRLYTIVHAGAQISGITCRRQIHHDGANILYGTTLAGKWTNCLFDQMPRHHSLDSLSDKDDCIGTRPNPKYPGSYMFHSYGPAGQGNTQRYRRCKAIGDFVTTTAGFGTHSSSLGTSCQKRIIYEDCENIGTIGFGGYDCDYFDIIRPKNRDCITDFGFTANIMGRVIDGDCTGAFGDQAITVPSTGKTLQLIRTKIVANTVKSLARATQNAGTIDVQEGCELLWNGQNASGATAFFLSDGNYTWDKIKARRSILGAIGSAKGNFAQIVGASTPMVATWDIDDSIVGGFLTNSGNNTVYPVLQVVNNGTAAGLAGTAGFGTAIQQLADLRKLYTGDPVRDGTAKRLGANWPISSGFNAADALPTGGNTQLFFGRQIVATGGYRAGSVTATPTGELFGGRWVGAATAVACGANGLIMLTTNYGASWSVPASSVGLTTATLRAVAFTGTTVIAVGDGGVILRSTDSGTTWAAVAAPGGTTDLLCAIYASGKFVAAGANGNVQYSTDGSTGSWTLTTAVNTATTWRAIAYATTAAVFVLGGDTLLNGAVATSATGTGSWTSGNLPSFNGVIGIASDGTTTALICRLKNRQGAELITSTAPATASSWTGQALDLPFDPAAIAYAGNSNLRWTITGRSTVQAFAWDATSEWRYEEVVRTTPAALRATRVGAEGWLASA